MGGLSKNKYREMNLYDLIISAQETNYEALEELIRREQKRVYTSFCYLGARSSF